MEWAKGGMQKVRGGGVFGADAKAAAAKSQRQRWRRRQQLSKLLYDAQFGNFPMRGVFFVYFSTMFQ